jgi:hypothetical protein
MIKGMIGRAKDYLRDGPSKKRKICRIRMRTATRFPGWANGETPFALRIMPPFFDAERASGQGMSENAKPHKKDSL